MADFVRRTEAPTTDNAYYYADNPFYQYGYGLPNCTCYAFGRFWELKGGDRPSLSWGDAEKWYGHTSDGYERGSVPKLGAVACWRRGDASTDSDGAGHVAIVEKVYSDGRFLCSNSAYNSTMWYEKTLSPDEDYTWNSKYTFQGFIYNPVDFENEDTTPDTVDKSQVVSGNRYLTLAEMQVNARYIYQFLSSRGWTLNAIAGMLGNFQKESTINPGIWQSLDEGNTSLGYGLVQWTPATKYLDWCTSEGLEPSDMDSALLRIIYELENGLQYYPTDDYPETFSQFKTSTKSAYYLGMAFVYNYERPASATSERGENAQYWYDYLLPFAGGSVPSGGHEWRPDPNKKNIPLWLLVSAVKRR